MSSKHYRPILVTLLVPTTLIGLACMFYFGASVPIKEQSGVYAMLRNVSGVMFGVFGLWIGLLYPGLRERVFKKTANEETVGAKNPAHEAQRLLEPFFVSLVVLLVAFAFDIVSPLLKRVTFLQEWKWQMRGVSYLLIGLLSLAIVISIFRAMRMTDAFAAAIGIQNSKNEKIAKIRQNRNQ